MGLVELLGSKNLRQHFSVGNNKTYSVTLFMIFLTIFLIILGRCFLLIFMGFFRLLLDPLDFDTSRSE